MYVHYNAWFRECKALYNNLTASSLIHVLKVHMIVSICRLYHEQPYLRKCIFLNL